MPELPTFTDMMEADINIADRIKTIRDRTGMSQADLARAIGIDRQAVNNWEHGRYKPNRLTFYALSRWAEQLDKSP